MPTFSFTHASDEENEYGINYITIKSGHTTTKISSITLDLEDYQWLLKEMEAQQSDFSCTVEINDIFTLEKRSANDSWFLVRDFGFDGNFSLRLSPEMAQSFMGCLKLVVEDVQLFC
jgi:hypothetical protein